MCAISTLLNPASAGLTKVEEEGLLELLLSEEHNWPGEVHHQLHKPAVTSRPSARDAAVQQAHSLTLLWLTWVTYSPKVSPWASQPPCCQTKYAAYPMQAYKIVQAIPKMGPATAVKYRHSRAEATTGWQALCPLYLVGTKKACG